MLLPRVGPRDASRHVDEEVPWHPELGSCSKKARVGGDSVNVALAFERFISDCEARGLRAETIAKYRLLERESHALSLAKKAGAFFKISRSIRSR